MQKHGIFRFLHVEADDGFVKTRGVQLMLNGSPFYANGFNAYWLMYTATDPSERYKVSSAFQEASKRGLTIGRTWAFSDGGYRPLQSSPGSYNEQTFQVSFFFFFFFPGRSFGLWASFMFPFSLNNDNKIKICSCFGFSYIYIYI
jgi:mannan endo-1,4-beta-mannosidase